MYNSYTYIYTLQKIPNRNKHYQQKTRWHRWIDNFDYLINSSNVTGFQRLRPSRVTLSIMAEVVMQDASFSCVRIKLVKRTNVLIECFVYPQMTLLLPFDSVYFCFIKPNQKNLVCSGLFSYVRNPLNCSLIQKSRE